MVSKKELMEIPKDNNVYGAWVLNVLDYIQNNEDETFNAEWENILKVSNLRIIR